MKKKMRALLIILSLLLCFLVLYLKRMPDLTPLVEVPMLPNSSEIMLADYFKFAWDRVDISQTAMDDDKFDYDALKIFEKNYLMLSDYHGAMIFYSEGKPVHAQLYLGSNLAEGTERVLFTKDGVLLPNRISLTRAETKFLFTKVGETYNFELLVD